MNNPTTASILAMIEEATEEPNSLSPEWVAAFKVIGTWPGEIERLTAQIERERNRTEYVASMQGQGFNW